MRNYADWSEAHNEIKRDLAELGVEVRLSTMQDKNIEGDPAYFTKELWNYIYVVLDPLTEAPNYNEEWVDQEWRDRLAGEINPGKAWRLRPEVWEPLMEKLPQRGKMPHFSYTYSERMGGKHLDLIVEELKKHPTSRQLWLPVWKADPDERRRGERRVPCSLGYHFLFRQDMLHMTYVMRSCDLITHWANDVTLASRLLDWVAGEAEMPVGSVTHFVGSLHCYAKDVEGVF